MTKRGKKNNIVKKIFITIFAILLISIIIFGVYAIAELIIEPTDVIVVNNGELYSEESSEGYIIREEMLIEENSEKKLVQIKSEGEKVSKGEVIFRYNTNEEEGVENQIQELTVEIQEALEGQTDLFSSDIKALEEQIEGKLEGINKKNNIQNIREYKNDISTYITKKAKIAGSLSTSGKYIKSLIEQKEELEQKLSSMSEYVYAPQSGVVSYRIDDLEEVFKTSDFSYITSEFLEDLNLKTGQVINTSNNKSKIVNNYKCYVATCLESEEAKNIEVNKRVKLRIADKEKVEAKIVYKKDESKENVIIVFEINDEVASLIEYRKVSMDVIWWEVEGLKVAKEAIYYDEGLAYVLRNRDGHFDKLLVKIEEENDDYCIVNSYTTEELKKIGFSTEEINKYKKINLYDEIVVNPNMSI